MRSWLMLGILGVLSCDAFVGANPIYCAADKPCQDTTLQCNLTTHVCESPDVLSKDPDIKKISPFAVSRAGGFAVKVTGQNFDRLQSITIGQVNAEFTASSPTELSLTIPPMPGACGPVPILLTSTEGRIVQKADKLRYRADKLDFLLNVSQNLFDVDVAALQNIKLQNDPIDDMIAINYSRIPDFSYIQGIGGNAFTSKDVPARSAAQLTQIIPTRLFADSSLDLVGSNGSDRLQLWRFTGSLANYDIMFNEVELIDMRSHMAIGVGAFDGNSNEPGIALLSRGASQAAISVIKLDNKGQTTSSWQQDIDLQDISYSRMAVGDFNKDGFSDIALVGKNAVDVIVLINNKMMGWVPAAAIQIKTTNNRVLVADMNGDGRDDIVAYGTSGSVGLAVNVIYNDVKSGFVSYTVPTAISIIQDLALTDFDCDGLPDLVINANDTIGVHINLGDSFAEHKDIPLGGKIIRAMTAGTYDASARGTIILAVPNGNGMQTDTVLLVGQN